MSAIHPIAFVISALDATSENYLAVTAKQLACSLTRSLFDGDIFIYRNNPIPLFKIDRRQVHETFVPIFFSEPTSEHYRIYNKLALFNHSEMIHAEARQWVFVADHASISIRNIDHLVRSITCGGIDAEHDQPDLYWVPSNTFMASASSSIARASSNRMSTGFWAVKGSKFIEVIKSWKTAWEIHQHHLSDDEIWSQAISSLSMRTKQFEEGEVIVPKIDSLDWSELCRSAFISLPDWPYSEQIKFLQAIYFGTYLGDGTGMIVNMMDT